MPRGRARPHGAAENAASPGWSDRGRGLAPDMRRTPPAFRLPGILAQKGVAGAWGQSGRTSSSGSARSGNTTTHVRCRRSDRSRGRRGDSARQSAARRWKRCCGHTCPRTDRAPLRALRPARDGKTTRHIRQHRECLPRRVGNPKQSSTSNFKRRMRARSASSNRTVAPDIRGAAAIVSADCTSVEISMRLKGLLKAPDIRRSSRRNTPNNKPLNRRAPQRARHGPD